MPGKGIVGTLTCKGKVGQPRQKEETAVCVCLLLCVCLDVCVSVTVFSIVHMCLSICYNVSLYACVKYTCLQLCIHIHKKTSSLHDRTLLCFITENSSRFAMKQTRDANSPSQCLSGETSHESGNIKKTRSPTDTAYGVGVRCSKRCFAQSFKLLSKCLCVITFLYNTRRDFYTSGAPSLVCVLPNEAHVAGF